MCYRVRPASLYIWREGKGAGLSPSRVQLGVLVLLHSLAFLLLGLGRLRDIEDYDIL
jgi:hypothetical protein